jgi:hypothetical protein
MTGNWRLGTGNSIAERMGCRVSRNPARAKTKCRSLSEFGDGILQRGHERRDVFRKNLPHDVVVHFVVPVYQAVAQPDYTEPGDIRVFLTEVRRNPRRGFADDFEKATSARRNVRSSS